MSSENHSSLYFMATNSSNNLVADNSFRNYLKQLTGPIVLLGLSLIFLSSIIWHFYPTFVECCDALSYWEISENQDIVKNFSHRCIRTFAYPLFLSVAAFTPRFFHLGINSQYTFIALVQLGIHFFASLLLGYSIYLYTNNKHITSLILFLYGLDIFLISYTNQVLTDGLAVSWLVISLSLLSQIKLYRKASTIKYLAFGISIGILPMIRPSFSLFSLVTYFLFVVMTIHSANSDKSLLRSIAVKILISSMGFVLPLIVQLLHYPQVFENLGHLGKMHLNMGAYVYKYITVHITREKIGLYSGAYSINPAMKEISTICQGVLNNQDCLSKFLIEHPFSSLKHYLIKLFALNDQVYLTPYIKDFFTPERYIWRGINCILLSLSVGGIVTVYQEKIKRNFDRCKYLLLATFLIISSLLTPLIASVPEERFGLIFHPFFVISTSYYINRLVDRSNVRFKSDHYIKMFCVVSGISLFFLSMHIEKSFNI